MDLSKRETYIGVAAVVAVAVLAADRLVITPVLDAKEALEVERDRLVLQMEEASRLFERRRLMARKWRELTAGGLTDDPAEAESRLFHATHDWAEDVGLTLSAQRPERTDQDGRVHQIKFMTSGSGRMEAVARLLWRMETTELPLRISEVQIGSRRDGADDLSLQLMASTLYLEPEATAPAQEETDVSDEEGA
jgi:hypothetical protein